MFLQNICSRLRKTILFELGPVAGTPPGVRATACLRHRWAQSWLHACGHIWNIASRAGETHTFEKKNASRLRETPTSGAWPAKREPGRPRKCQYFLTNRYVLLGPKEEVIKEGHGGSWKSQSIKLPTRDARRRPTTKKTQRFLLVFEAIVAGQPALHIVRDRAELRNFRRGG